jgi:hypothetical protein
MFSCDNARAGPQHPLPGGGAVQQGELRRRVHQQLRLGRDPGGEMRLCSIYSSVLSSLIW